MNRKDEIHAILIANTARKKRQMNLLDIADAISEYKNTYGSLTELANSVQISVGMLRKFLAVNSLSGEVRKLVKVKIIDSVETVNALSKFPANDQLFLYKKIAKDKLNSQDIRALRPLRKQFSKVPISDLVDKLIKTKSERISVVKFSRYDLNKKIPILEKDLKSIIGSENFIMIEIEDEIGNIKITREGEKLFRKHARLKSMSLEEFVIQILS